MNNKKHNFTRDTERVGRVRWYHGETPTGEKITVEITDCESAFKYKRSCAWFWRYDKKIKTKRGAQTYKYKSVQTYCERPRTHSICLELYNPTIKANGREISHKYDHSADDTILSAIWKQATENKEASEPTKWGEFDDLTKLSDKDFQRLYNKARRLFAKLPEKYITKYGNYLRFENESCFISSSDLHGFYFPNINSDLVCIAFKNGRAVAVYDMGGE